MLTRKHNLDNYGLVTPFGDMKLVQNWLVNGFLPGGTKPFPEPMLTCNP